MKPPSLQNICSGIRSQAPAAGRWCPHAVSSTRASARLPAFTPINQMTLMEQRLAFWARAFEASSEGIMIIDPQGRILDVNRAVCRSTKLDLDDLLGMNPRFLLDNGNPPGFIKNITDAALIMGSWQGEAWLKRKGREPYPA